MISLKASSPHSFSASMRCEIASMRSPESLVPLALLGLPASRASLVLTAATVSGDRQALAAPLAREARLGVMGKTARMAKTANKAHPGRLQHTAGAARSSVSRSPMASGERKSISAAQPLAAK